MSLASLSMFVTAIIEIIRQTKCESSNIFNGSSPSDISSLHIFYQLPQDILMGLSEIFVIVATFEFAYLAAPRSAQTLFMSLQFCSLGISSFIGIGYLTIYSNGKSFDFKVCINKFEEAFLLFMLFCFSVLIIINGVLVFIFLFSLVYKLVLYSLLFYVKENFNY